MENKIVDYEGAPHDDKGNVTGPDLNPEKDPSSAYPIAAETDLYAQVNGIAAPAVKNDAVYKVVIGVQLTVTVDSVSTHSSSLRQLGGQQMAGVWHLDRRSSPFGRLPLTEDKSWDVLSIRSKK